MSSSNEQHANGVIQNLHRIKSSETGNPRWGFQLVTDDGPDLDMISASNVWWAYEVTHHWEGKRIRVIYTEPASASKPRIAQYISVIVDTSKQKTTVKE